MNQAIQSKVSLALDVWSSPNGHAFLAIVLSYVTDDWTLGMSLAVGYIHEADTLAMLEEHLIDFQELIGQHSGDTLGEAVWKTIEYYGLAGKVCYHDHPQHFFSYPKHRSLQLYQTTRPTTTR